MLKLDPNEAKQTLKNQIEFYLKKINELDIDLVKYAKDAEDKPANVLKAYF